MPGISADGLCRDTTSQGRLWKCSNLHLRQLECNGNNTSDSESGSSRPWVLRAHTRSRGGCSGGFWGAPTGLCPGLRNQEPTADSSEGTATPAQSCDPTSAPGLCRDEELENPPGEAEGTGIPLRPGTDPGLPQDEELGNPQIGGMEPGPPQTPVKELRSLQSRGPSRGDGTGIPPQTWACPGVMQLGSPLRHRQSIRDPPPTWGRSRCDEPGPSSQGTRGCPGRSPAQRSPLPAGPATAVR